MRKPIPPPDLVTSPNYMTWFRLHSKLYLLLEEERSRQYRRRRPRRPCMNPRSGVHASMESSSTPTPHEAPMGAQPPDQY
ncbi:hypothetical protein Golob_004921, partial [Gossypium lobatum]|nr:hypothetical protein [Gossypium lobatum]